ncbi:MAG: cation diffusion facilitator family transporter [Ralstonia sp.]|jgi:cation diffusion facilitator family transporter|nr:MULTISPECIES: cation diffusion facilitator family transporter [Ralstonia]MBA9877031.1 cation transporter [Ralstonia pickettii]MBA9881985.1 cation transporter [Ralstonia pickettii]MBA9886839.1 cation transporter [Ralstonia pickettii]MBA9892287.1 cation transporter [Ralstonia pickettii]MBA9924101.1 cation transporter [Ralstonia pickettii]
MQQPTEIDLDSETPAMRRAAKRSTLVSVGVNLTLTAAQLIAGVLAHSQALIADAIHSLSDLVSDFVVLFAGHHSQKGPDAEHHYGHLRFETAASLVLGLLLLAVGIGMLWNSVTKLEHPESISQVKLIGLWVALGALVSKELLFRYMLAVAERVRSSMLIANAWHARSDAASSLVVALGIVGNLLGFPLLDPVAAFVVGLMVSRMGWQFGSDALHDLMDRAVDEETATEIREVILGTPGVLGVHDVRTRKMGDMILVDAHLEIAGSATVKVGHDIALEARRRVLERRDVLNVMTHVDPVVELPPGTS